jgi:hypothetical protein
MIRVYTRNSDTSSPSSSDTSSGSSSYEIASSRLALDLEKKMKFLSILHQTPQLRVADAMLMANFLDDDIADIDLRNFLQSALPGSTVKAMKAHFGTDVNEYNDDNGLIFANHCNPTNNCVKRCFNTCKEKTCSHDVDKESLNRIGQYVIFPARWWHRGYFAIRSERVYYTAQLFCTAAQDITSWQIQTRRENTKMKIDKLPFKQVRAVSNDIQNNWDTTYSDSKFPPSKAFDGEKVDRGTNRHLKDGAFRKVPEMNELVSVFELANRHLRVKSVWLIKKNKDNGGFQSWHRDFYLGTDIIATIVVNVGVWDKMDSK